MNQNVMSARSSLMLAGIDRMIELLEAQAGVQSNWELEAYMGQRRGQARKETTPRLEELELFIVRLHQVKELLQQDPQLLPVVDEYIGQQIRSMEKRQSVQNIRLAALTTVAGVVLGWLTSALASPVTLWHLLMHWL